MKRYSIKRLFEAYLDIDKFTRDADDGGKGHGDWAGQMSKPRKKPVPTTGQRSAVSNKNKDYKITIDELPDEVSSGLDKLYDDMADMYGQTHINKDDIEFTAEDYEGETTYYAHLDGTDEDSYWYWVGDHWEIL